MKIKGYEQYTNDVLSGAIISNEYIKLVVERFNNFRYNRPDIYFDEKKVEDAISFIGSIKLYEGEAAGQSFKLENWQQFIIAYIFGMHVKSTGKRLINNTFIFIARKNGKSCFAAAIAMYLLIADGENSPSVLMVGNNTIQAHQLFEKGQEFAYSLDPKHKVLKIFRNEIRCKFNVGKLKICSTSLKTIEGNNPSAYILDEYHQATDNKVLNSLKYGQGARKNPLGIIITTAGDNQQSPCREMYDTSIEILKGLKTDDTYFPMLFTLDEGDDIEDQKNWIKSNPNLGVSKTYDNILKEFNEQKNMSSLEFDFKSRVMNIWTSSADTWISHNKLTDISSKIDFKAFSGMTCYVGIDLSTVDDLTAVSVLFHDTIKDKYYFKTKYYLPIDALDKNTQKINLKEWYRKKLITLTDGDVVDYDYIINDIVKLNELVTVHTCFYDSWGATQFAVQAQTYGLNMMPFSQSLASFNRPTKELERLIKQNKIIMDMNDITLFCFSNVVLKFFGSNCKPEKKAYKNKIDGVISMIMALGGYLSQPKNTFFVY